MIVIVMRIDQVSAYCPQLLFSCRGTVGVFEMSKTFSCYCNQHPGNPPKFRLPEVPAPSQHVLKWSLLWMSLIWGVAITVQGGTACAKIPLTTPLEAVASRNLLDCPLTICSLYIPPNTSPQLQDLHGLIAELSHSLLLLGDFNGHSLLWGIRRLNSRDNLIERFLLDSFLRLSFKRPHFS